MENLGTYFLIALAIGWIIYYSNKKKSSTPQAKAPAKPRAAAASKAGSKKPSPKKGSKGPKKGEKATGASPVFGLGMMGATTGKQSGLSLNQSELDLIAELSLDPVDKEPAKNMETSKAPKASPAASPQFDLENEVKQLQARTGWDYDTAKAYCLQATEYHQKIAEPARLKNN